ncbi:MAG: hypothetical protein H6746_14500 [Deltaproteobacteria bacterium]|nr:hypothetical protein [Deltaproteobacteria bacterium]
MGPALAAALGLWAALLAGCGGGVTMLRTDDPRLPVEARRWVADAEDGVLVARAMRDRSAGRLEATIERSHELGEEADELAQAGAGDAAEHLRQVAEARVALARDELRLAETEVAMAEARRAQINAQTAVRHDLAVYELEPLERATEAALAETRRQRAHLDQQRADLAQLTSAWWESYARFTAQSGQRNLLWQ